MKPINMQLLPQKTLLVLLAVLGLSFGFPSMLLAQDGDDQLETETIETYVVGPFDGVDLKERFIWINDKAYNLDRTIKVKGSSTKLGLLNDIKPQEIIRATLRPNLETPSVPYVVMIERL